MIDIRRNGPAPGCRNCGLPLQHLVVDLGVSPLANSYLKPNQLNQMERFYPLKVYVCKECFLAQIESLAAPEEIFKEYPYFSSYSETWLQHASEYARMIIERFQLDQRSRVIEIASNDGYLLQYFAQRGFPVTGIEPAANVAEAAVRKGIPTLVKFFNTILATQLAQSGMQADLIVANNVLAHVPELNDFVKGLKLVLHPDGLLTLEFPHLMRLMEENQFDTVYHEHLSYFSLMSVDRIFAKHGLMIFDVEELPTHGGSLRVYVGHTERDSVTVGHRVRDLLRREKAVGLDNMSYYSRFSEGVQKIKRRLLDFLIRVKEDRKIVAAYGAAAKGNTLLNYCGLRSDFISYVVDRSPHKQGLFLPGTHIPIVHPDAIKETQPDYLLILPWNLKDEIMQQTSYIRSWGGHFVTPVPELRIYE